MNNYPHYAYFLLTSALFKHNFQKWRHMTSCDVTVSDLHEIFRKCSSSQTYTTLKVWNNYHESNWNKRNIRIFLVNLEKMIDFIKKTPFWIFFLNIRIELPKRSNHGKFHVKVCNWRATMAKYIFGHFGVSKQWRHRWTNSQWRKK